MQQKETPTPEILDDHFDDRVPDEIDHEYDDIFTEWDFL